MTNDREQSQRRDEATQLTQPKEGEPVEIPIPTREAFLRDLAKVAPPMERPATDERADDAGPPERS